MNRQHTRQTGLTLLELLIAVAILGVLMLAFTQLFGGSLRASSDIGARNELLSEGQIAQQLIVSRIKSASHVYPPGTSFTMTNTVRTRNTVRGTQRWTVGTDPVLAMIVPPEGSSHPGITTCNNSTQANKDMCFMFYAYFPVRRGVFIEEVNPKYAPNPDPANDDVWLLMEYRQHIYDKVNRRGNRLASPPDADAALADLGGSTAQILADYVQPVADAESRLFEIRPDGAVEITLRMGREQRGKRLELPPLRVRAYARNAP